MEEHYKQAYIKVQRDRQKLMEQNNRYREYLRRLQRATTRYPAEDMAYVVNKITSEALESEKNAERIN